MNNIKEIIIFGNGNISVINHSGEQVPELQKGYMSMICEFLENKGVNPANVKFIMPNNHSAIAFKVDNKWNWNFT